MGETGTITSYIAFSMANLLLGSMGLATRKDEINLIENTDLHTTMKKRKKFIYINCYHHT